jgi:hypothetical protein
MPWKNKGFSVKKRGLSLGGDKVIVSTMFWFPLGEGETFFEEKRTKFSQWTISQRRLGLRWPEQQILEFLTRHFKKQMLSKPNDFYIIEKPSKGKCLK